MKMVKALGTLLLAQLVFWGAGLNLGQEGLISIRLFMVPEFYVFFILAGLTALTLSIAEEDGFFAGLVNFLASLLFFHGLYTLCLFEVSGLGFVEWCYFALYLLVRLGLLPGEKIASPTMRAYSAFEIIVVTLALGIAKKIVQVALPANIFTEVLQYNAGMQSLLFFVFLGILIVYALRFVDQAIRIWKQRVKESGGEEAVKEAEAAGRRALKSIGRFFKRLVRGIGRFLSLLVAKIGLVPVVIGVAVLVLVPLVWFMASVRNYVLSLQRFFWQTGSLVLKNISTRRYYTEMNLLGNAKDIVLLLLVMVYAYVSRSGKRQRNLGSASDSNAEQPSEKGLGENEGNKSQEQP